jgi:hypothetical protein
MFCPKTRTVRLGPAGAVVAKGCWLLGREEHRTPWTDQSCVLSAALHAAAPINGVVDGLAQMAEPAMLQRRVWWKL